MQELKKKLVEVQNSLREQKEKVMANTLLLIFLSYTKLKYLPSIYQMKNVDNFYNWFIKKFFNLVLTN